MLEKDNLNWMRKESKLRQLDPAIHNESYKLIVQSILSHSHSALA